MIRIRQAKSLLWEQGVVGSNPTTPTKPADYQRVFFFEGLYFNFSVQQVFMSFDVDTFFKSSTLISKSKQLYFQILKSI